MTDDNDDHATKTDNPATLEPAEKPKKRKEEPALATGAKLMKI